MKTFRLVHAEARRNAIDCLLMAPDGYVVTVSEPNRSLEQNAALWPLLEAFSEQKTWQVNGASVKLSAEEWKDILTASFQAEQIRMAPLIGHTGMVVLGLRTSKMGKARFSEFLDYCHACAADLGVSVFSEDEHDLTA
jgi:hypothetical protein